MTTRPSSALAAQWALGVGQKTAIPETLTWKGQSWRLNDETPAARLWAHTAIEAHRDLVGHLPRPGPLSLPAPFTDISQPVLPEDLAQRWQSLALSEFSLLHELVGHLNGSGYRLPLSRWPELLDAMSKPGQAHPGLPSVNDSGLRWLLPLNTAWRSRLVEAIDPVAQWDTAPSRQRPAMLRQWRSRDPQLARERLAQDWPSLPSAERTELIQAMEVGLAASDETWLETVLDDRSRIVARHAGHLLARLPKSAFAARAMNRAQDWVRIERHLLRKSMEVVLPTEPDSADKRDGVDGKFDSPHLHHAGPKTKHLAQGLSLVPPRAWLDRWGLDVAGLHALLGKKDEQGIWVGLLEGAIIHRDSEILCQMLAPKGKLDYLASQTFRTHRDWLGKDGEALLLRLLPDQPDIVLWADNHQPWSEGISQGVLVFLQSAPDSTSGNMSHHRGALWATAGKCAPLNHAWHEELSRRAAAASSPWNEQIQDAWRLWCQRHAIAQGFASLPSASTSTSLLATRNLP